jgi:DNA-binding CsgD family transcriptional regulator
MGEMFGVEWSRLLSDAGSGAMVIDHDGRVVFANDIAARLFTKRSAAESRGMRLSDCLRPHAADERLEVSRRVLASGIPVVFAELWAGVALRATVRKLDAYPGAGGPAVLWLYAPESALIDTGHALEQSANVIEARHYDLGRLAGLTTSELKVLALIGEGLSNAEIAARLHRAVKTVESHRASLTEKTGCSSRVELGMMARRAGLIRRLDLPETGAAGKATPAQAAG